MNISTWSIRNPIPSILLFVILSVAGFYSFKLMKIQSFPDMDVPTVTVSASLPGAAPPQLETEVARKLEDTVSSVQGLKNLRTTIQDGLVDISAEFRLEKPVQEAVDEVRSAVQSIRTELPTDLRDPIVRKSSTSRANLSWPFPSAPARWMRMSCPGSWTIPCRGV
ncbi:TPA: efflux RND transporter permease subunit [Serratia marcescens]